MISGFVPVMSNLPVSAFTSLRASWGIVAWEPLGQRLVVLQPDEYFIGAHPGRPTCCAAGQVLIRSTVEEVWMTAPNRYAPPMEFFGLRVAVDCPKFM